MKGQTVAVIVSL